MDSWSDAYLEKKLQEARAQEEKAVKKKREESVKKGRLDALTLIKYGVYIWAARLGVLGLGFLFPLLGTLSSVLWFGSLGGPEASLAGSSWQQFQDTHALHPETLATTLQRMHTPLLLHSVPVPDADALRAALQSLQYPRIKVHDKPQFTYLDPQSSWTRRHPDRAGPLYATGAPAYVAAESVRGFPYAAVSPSTPGDCTAAGECPFVPPAAREQWWHVTLPLSGSVAAQLAPALGTLGTGAAAAEFRLWLARENVTVTPHYDTADNVFVQLAGSKTFLVASPEAQRFLRPFPSLHPGWRQSQRPYLVTMPSMLSAQRERKVPRSTLKLWQVTLVAGDMLYLPAYHFHSVVTGPDSVSVNAWMPSEASVVFDEVRRMVPMPFSPEDSRPAKLASLGAAFLAFLDAACVPAYSVPGSRPQEPLLASAKSDVVEMLTGRHRSLAQKREWCSAEASVAAAGQATAGACVLRYADQETPASRARVQQTAHTLALLLQASDASASVKDPHVRTLLALDWLEEALDGVLEQDSSPCSVMQFVSTCLGLV